MDHGLRPAVAVFLTGYAAGNAAPKPDLQSVAAARYFPGPETGRGDPDRHHDRFTADGKITLAAAQRPGGDDCGADAGL
ncbi:hypothetical protein D3C71_1451220 [compost metagenome]